MQKHFIYLFFILLLVQCTKPESVEPTEDNGFIVPKGFPAPLYNFSENPYSNVKRELGRKLFYDAKLSRDNTISCGSCHQQSAAFTHAGHRVSHGIDNLLGTRNSPTLFNLAWQPLFFWDGGVGDLDLFHINPIQNPVEMDETVSNVLTKLNTDSNYPSMFKEAFGTTDITSLRLFQALSIFMISLESYQSKYDDFLQGNKNALSATAKDKYYQLLIYKNEFLENKKKLFAIAVKRYELFQKNKIIFSKFYLSRFTTIFVFLLIFILRNSCCALFAWFT